MRTFLMVFVASLLSAPEAAAQSTPACRVLCAPEFKVEPTITSTNLFGSPRIVDEHGTTTREPCGSEFEVILSLGLLTRASWLEFTVEAIFLPFDRESCAAQIFRAPVRPAKFAATEWMLGAPAAAPVP